MAFKYDSILGKDREKDIIPQLSTDPTSPKAQDTWVLATVSAGSGGGVYKAALGLGFPYLSKASGGSSTYQLSYRTKEGTTKRVSLT